MQLEAKPILLQVLVDPAILDACNADEAMRKVAYQQAIAELDLWRERFEAELLRENPNAT